MIARLSTRTCKHDEQQKGRSKGTPLRFVVNGALLDVACWRTTEHRQCHYLGIGFNAGATPAWGGVRPTLSAIEISQ